MQYLIEQPSEYGGPIELMPGISYMRMPLPIRLNHINCYVLEDDHRFVIVDCGFNTEEIRNLWRELLDARLGDKEAVLICTHYHPDHFGLAGWLCREYGFTLHMTQTEWLIGNCLTHMGDDGFRTLQGNFYQRHGISEEALQAQMQRGNSYAKGVVTPPVDMRMIQEGDVISAGGRQWRVVIGRGHTPEHACLYCEADNLLITGDQILPKITPNTSVFAYNPGCNALGEFLESFDRFDFCDDDTVAFPSHGLPFRGVPGRLRYMREHHEERLDELLGFCASEKTAFDLVPMMFSQALDNHQMTFALGEIIAHLRVLVDRGLLDETERDAVLYYQRS